MFGWVRRIASPGSRARVVGKEIRTFSGAAKGELPAAAPPLDFGSMINLPAAAELRSPEMRIIVVAGHKGGSGKTTIAAHLAVQAEAAGKGPVVLIDTDPQGSLAAWWRARNDDAPALATVRIEELAANLEAVGSYGPALVIIDTPPALVASIEQVIAIADLVLIPARPSPHDLRAIGATVEMARQAGKPFLFVVNGAAPRANITAQAVAALAEHGRVAPVILYQRTGYAASMIDGRTVMQGERTGRSAQEIEELWGYISKQVSVPERTLSVATPAVRSGPAPAEIIALKPERLPDLWRANERNRGELIPAV